MSPKTAQFLAKTAYSYLKYSWEQFYNSSKGGWSETFKVIKNTYKTMKPINSSAS